MEHEGMVHALERIESLLRPDGSLIEIHPLLQAPVIEVRSHGHLVFAEPDPGYDYAGDLRRAEGAVAEVIRRRILAIDRSVEFDFLTYATSIKELRDFFALTGAYEDDAKEETLVSRQDEVYAQAADVMRSAEEAEIVYHERGRMGRLTRPIEGSQSS